MSKNRLYKNGKLTTEARNKLQNKLNKQNMKPRSRPTTHSLKKNPNFSKPASICSSSSKKAEVTFVATKNEGNKEQILSMDNICCETPPRQKLVNERKKAMEQNKDVNWISVINYNQKEAENEENLYSKLEHLSNKRFRKQLDEQITIKQKQNNLKNENVLKYQTLLKTKYKTNDKMDFEKKEIDHKKMLALKNMRLTQMKELSNRRRFQELRLKKIDLRATQKLKRELLAEKKQKQEKKILNKQKLQQMLVDNDKQKALKLQELKLEELEAIQLQKVYIKMCDEQDLKREQRLLEIQKKQQQKFQALVNANKDLNERAAADSKKAKIEQIRLQKLDDVKQAKKKAKLKADMDECKRIIAQQIIEKEDRMRVEIEEDRRYGLRMKELANEYQKELEAEKLKKYQTQKQNAGYLEEQIEKNEKRRVDAKTEMSAAEKGLNKQLLDVVRENVNSNSGKMTTNVEIDQKAPFAWRYSYRKAPF